MDYEELRGHYRTLSDEDIERIALNESGELLPEALDVLKEEIGRRRLSRDFGAAIDIRARGASDEEVEDLAGRIARFPCPVCGSDDEPLNAFVIATARAFLLFYAVRNSFLLACPDCIAARGRRGLIVSLLLGWWHFPFGPIATIQAIAKDRKAINCRRETQPTKEFLDFVKTRFPAARARIETASSIDELFEGSVGDPADEELQRVLDQRRPVRYFRQGDR